MQEYFDVLNEKGMYTGKVEKNVMLMDYGIKQCSIYNQF